ncbi:hypothetical protein [Teredinibacter purpureus]|uniref:hypothetical protein n=1 Tax=Teredinibacter purpureus TaxID=2731756 RepID=UPI0005F7F1D3|nr:hypothetical protein [Teredinibacter purpureus]
MRISQSKKEFWLSFIVLLLVMFSTGVALHDWLAAILVVFVTMSFAIGVAFNKDKPRMAGAYGGAVAGLGISLLFLFFGPIQFYG